MSVPQSANENLVDALRLTSQRLVLLRVTQPWDAEPTVRGDVELHDCENDATLHVSADADVPRRYGEAYRTYFAALDAFAAARGATQVVVDASADTLSQSERSFPGGVLSL